MSVYYDTGSTTGAGTSLSRYATVSFNTYGDNLRAGRSLKES